MFTAFYIPHIILIESKQRLYPTKWKTRFASCLDGPCLKLYAISVDQHNCQQMDSTFVAVADFPYFFHFLKSVEAGNLFNGKAPNLWSFRISVSRKQGLISTFAKYFYWFVCLFVAFEWLISLVFQMSSVISCKQQMSKFFFACCVCLFVCSNDWNLIVCILLCSNDWYLWSLKSFNISWVQLYLESKVWHQQMPNLIKGNPPADSVTQFRREKYHLR